MPRANRHFLSGYVWHITHRCHQKQFLLKFACDRRRYLRWLFEAKKRFGLSVLNYIVRSNHLLVWEERWTGDYIFENEWQFFRTKKDRSLELTSVFHECAPGRRKLAVKVVDIFGNDTMTFVDVNVGGKK
jgi:hypothetical protein